MFVDTMIDCGPSEERRYTLQKDKEALHEKGIYRISKCCFWQKVFIGIDVHKDSCHVTARKDGEEVFNGRIPASYHSLMKLLERFKDCQIKVAYEAGLCGFSIYDNLMGDGIDTIVVPPSLIPVE